MKREPEPYFREYDGWWYVQVRVGGKRKQIKLAKGRECEEEARKEYHRVMTAIAEQPDEPEPPPADDSVRVLLNVFHTEYVKRECSDRTQEWYKYLLTSFRKHVGNELTFAELKTEHVTAWLNAHKNWSQSTRGCGVRAVRTCFRWLKAQGKVDRYPFDGLKAPRSKRREKVIPPPHFEKIVAAVRDNCFKDYLRFLYLTGARPQEANSCRKRHVELGLSRIVFPPSEAKGGEYPRVIYLNDEAKAIVAKLWARRKKDDDHVFLNSRHRPWDRNSVRNRFRRLREKIGHVCAYHLRHSWATIALQHLDPITVSVLMGHSDASTLARTYQHLAKSPEFMQNAARKARGA